MPTLLALLLVTSNAHAVHWKADICRGFLLTAQPEDLRFADVGGLREVVFDHTYHGDTDIARFFTRYEGALKEGHRQNARAIRAESWHPRDLATGAARRAFASLLWLAAWTDVWALLVGAPTLTMLSDLSHPYLYFASIGTIGALGGFDFPVRYGRSYDLARVRFALRARAFRRKRVDTLDWTYQARVSETFARALAEVNQVDHRDVFRENVRSVTAGLWRGWLSPASTRYRWITVRVRGSHRPAEPTLRVSIEVSRDKLVD